jgi:CubicO group peptidase (beta-lactamase class C family)
MIRTHGVADSEDVLLWSRRPPGRGPARAWRHWSRLFITAALAVAALCDQTALLAEDPPSVTTIPPTDHLDRGFAAVDERIAGWISAGYYRGASLVLEQDGRLLWQRRYGDHRADSVEFIASAGKWLASATILSVIDGGTLSLDDRVATYLPAFTGSSGAATLRQLLSHTSGYQPSPPAGSPPDTYQTLTEAIAAIRLLPLAHEPGTQWEYGGLAMQVAGRMAELASGLDFETLFQRSIALPVGMTSTHFTPVDGGFGHGPMLAGGARSSLQDYRRFLAMISADGLVDGRRVLSSRAIAAMLADQVGPAIIPPGNFVTTVRQSRHHGIYGLGVWRELEDDQGRALLISSPSWAGTYPWIDRRHHLTGVFLAHVQGPILGKFDQFNPMTASAALPVLVDQALRAMYADRPPSPASP